jgi:hypothetical protein
MRLQELLNEDDQQNSAADLASIAKQTVPAIEVVMMSDNEVRLLQHSEEHQWYGLEIEVDGYNYGWANIGKLSDPKQELTPDNVMSSGVNGSNIEVFKELVSGVFE